MFTGGSLWKPPPLNPFLQGMPEELVEIPPKLPLEPQKGTLSDTQREKFEELLRNINPEKYRVAEAMIYCIEHAEAFEEVVECIQEAIAAPDAPLHKKIARLYLVSDVLHNCSVKVGNASCYRKGFQAKLPEIFKDLNECYQNIEGRLRAEQFKQRVMNCFRAWEDWAIYPSEFLIRLQNAFLGLVSNSSKDLDDDADTSNDTMQMQENENLSDDIDGVPLGNDDIDGVPLDAPVSEEQSDIDGVPLSDDIDGQPLDDEKSDGAVSFSSKFKPSKWEMVDPEIVEAQAFTTSKWDLLEQADEEESEEKSADNIDDLDGQPMEECTTPDGDTLLPDEDNSQESTSAGEHYKIDFSEQRRAKLREAELKVMKYQDELESGKRNRKPHMRFSEQVEHYRQKLLKKIEREGSDREKHRRDRHKSHSISPHMQQISFGTPSSEERERSQSPPYILMKKLSPRSVAMPLSESTHSPHRSRHHRSRSPKKNRRSRSRSPKRTRRSRSKSPHKRQLSPMTSPIRKHKSKKAKH